MAVSVKAYLNFESETQEIRRFSIAQDVSASYAYLVEKVRQVFSSLLRKEFKIYWRDGDGEFVVFSSDEELIMALGSSEGDNFKIFIEEIRKEEGVDGGSQEKNTKHPGVICDVCDKEIFGSRFKCLSCPDYDLCSGCECKGFHPEHEMLRIRNPLEHPWQGFMPFFFGHGRRRRGGGCPWKQGRPSHGPGPHRGRPHCSPSRGAHCSRGRDRYQSGGPGPFGGAGAFGGFGPWASANCWTNQPNQKEQSKTESGNGDEKKDGQPPFTTFQDIFDHVTQSLGQTENGKGDGKKDGQPAFNTFQDIFDHVTQTLGEQFKVADPCQSWGSEGASCCKDDEKKKSQEKAADEEPSKEVPADDDVPMPHTESFVVVNEEKADSQAQSEKQATPKQQQRRPEAEEFERKLNEAIKQMESMGFNNDSGWLSQLLIAKDFDIGKVIDTLQYRS